MGMTHARFMINAEGKVIQLPFKEKETKQNIGVVVAQIFSEQADNANEANEAMIETLKHVTQLNKYMQKLAVPLMSSSENLTKLNQLILNTSEKFAEIKEIVNQFIETSENAYELSLDDVYKKAIEQILNQFAENKIADNNNEIYKTLGEYTDEFDSIIFQIVDQGKEVYKVNVEVEKGLKGNFTPKYEQILMRLIENIKFVLVEGDDCIEKIQKISDYMAEFVEVLKFRKSKEYNTDEGKEKIFDMIEQSSFYPYIKELMPKRFEKTKVEKFNTMAKLITSALIVKSASEIFTLANNVYGVYNNQLSSYLSFYSESVSALTENKEKMSLAAKKI